MKRAALLFFCLASLPACILANSATQTGPNPVVQDIAQTEASQPGDGFTATPITLNGPEKEELSLYTFEVDFDFREQRLLVFERIDYANRSEGSLYELLLVVDAINQGAAFELDELAWGNGHVVQNYELSGGLLRLPLPEPLAPGERVTLVVRYQLTLPEKGGPLGYSEWQSNFADWYPFVPPYQAGTGWLIHLKAQVGEHLVYESANFEVLIRLGATPEALLIAAPAPAQEREDGLFYRLQRARRFVWSASDRLELLTGQVGEIPVQAFVLPEHQPAGEAALRVCIEALKLLQELFGPYPYESISLVEANFPDGLESDGLFFLNLDFFANYAGGRQNFLSTLIVHEVAHNWWFGQVGNDAALEPWLDEALATYSEALYYEQAYPELLDWWWQFRVLDYAPRGMVDSNIYEHAAFEPYVQAVYFRGALFLDALRGEMGDEAFFDFLRAYATQGSGKVMSGDEFFALLSVFSSEEYKELIINYFAR